MKIFRFFSILNPLSRCIYNKFPIFIHCLFMVLYGIIIPYQRKNVKFNLIISQKINIQFVNIHTWLYGINEKRKFDGERECSLLVRKNC